MFNGNESQVAFVGYGPVPIIGICGKTQAREEDEKLLLHIVLTLIDLSEKYKGVPLESEEGEDDFFQLERGITIISTRILFPTTQHRDDFMKKVKEMHP